MKQVLAAIMMAGAVVLIATDASAQSTDSNWINVNATVVGIFDFQIDGDDWNDPATDAATYNFGDVSVDGTTTGSATATTPDDATAIFTADNAFAWSVMSAPRRDVTFTFQNASKNGALGLDDLRLSMDDATLFKLDGTDGTTLHSVNSVGNGTNGVTGSIDLELTITDTDVEGTTSYTVELVATGV